MERIRNGFGTDGWLVNSDGFCRGFHRLETNNNGKMMVIWLKNQKKLAKNDLNVSPEVSFQDFVPIFHLQTNHAVCARAGQRLPKLHETF